MPPLCTILIHKKRIKGIRGPLLHLARRPANGHKERAPFATSTSLMPDEVLLLGLGAVGTLYAYIFQSGGANVTAVCRSNYQVVRDHGIDIVSDKFGEHPKWRPTRVIQRPEDVDAVGVTFDYIVCCSKHVPDLQPVSDVLRPYLTQNFAKKPQRLPVILLLQNGIDIEHDSY